MCKPICMAWRPQAIAGFLMALLPDQGIGFRGSGCSVEITFMPVDIVNTYLEIQQLRKEVRKAELDLGISLPRPPNRSFPARPMEARGSRMTDSQTLLIKRVRIN